MARKTQQVVLDDFAFYQTLLTFYNSNKGRIRQHYRDLTKKFLDFNEDGFLRQPQFEALEIYVFLKEGLDNAAVHDVFKQWRDSENVFKGRHEVSLFEDLNRAQYDALFSRMRRFSRSYPNYIFALTMGTGKTILMATCIFYEFLLANKFPKDPLYCHNALVFAPDKTVLQALREIQTFDMTKVVPPEYVNFLTAHLKFHFLDEAGTALSTLDKSNFNLIISNTQKIILKKQHKDKSATDKLFDTGRPTYQANTVYEAAADLYGFDEPEDEDSLTTNQRFQKLQRLEQLGVYVDEAHHAFGTKLAEDMGAKDKDSTTSLRRTIDELAASLRNSGTHVVACYNYTGTPYVGKEILPEVVYAYGLQEAISKEFLKKVKVHGYSNPRTQEFLSLSIADFLEKVGDKRYEGMLPKMAFFAATVDELTHELRPAIEAVLAQHHIPASRILVNVGDDKVTSNDDIREFNRLDTPESDKQFILLVNKGREGWNCRSLFGVGLFRKPKSRIFVLQATMRCLRAITEIQQTGNVYLSAENKEILEDELQQNFRASIDDIEKKTDDKITYEVRPSRTPVKVKLRRVHKLFKTVEKEIVPGYSLGLDVADREAYRLIHTEQEGFDLHDARRSHLLKEDLTAYRVQQRFSRITLVAEVSRYLNRSPLAIGDILGNTAEGVDGILTAVNEFNELLYDCVIPKLFHALYEVKEYKDEVDFEVELVKAPPKEKACYEVRALPSLVDTPTLVNAKTPGIAAKSFHLDHYCFDSTSEKTAFWKLLNDKRVDHIYFTGMLTHGQSDFFIQYIDPDSHTIRTYYPDFLIQESDGSYTILEVKADYQIDVPVIQAKKQFAQQMAVASGMRYAILPSTQADVGNISSVFVR